MESGIKYHNPNPQAAMVTINISPLPIKQIVTSHLHSLKRPQLEIGK
jgi:hypothetical protein